ncbi:MAG: biotin synthase BioB [Alphaproteobacteria bacterium]|nr:MAG: biotin synthase BioB [Alphaproteobacteria bacterium]
MQNPSLPLRTDWQLDEVAALFDLPFPDLMFQAQTVHRAHFSATQVQASTLLSIKTGGCPEDCKYCPQSAHFDTPVNASKLLDIETVITAARHAKEAGATRFCMGAAWRSPKERDMPKVTQMIQEVRALGLETCMTLGMLDAHQAHQLKEAGLDYYNHNLDSSEEFYKEIITTRTYHDRLTTLEHVRDAGINTCCGGIVGMGETREDRIAFLHRLATLPSHPQSVPINQLVQVEGTPLHGAHALDPLEFVRMIAVARILMPASYVRLSAGRETMDDATQTLCLLAGANSIFFGETLLTTPNPATHHDQQLLKRLGMHFESSSYAA